MDEIEITLFGPGYGEAAAVHLGCGSWILVDSCIDPASKNSAGATYLEGLRTTPDCVLAIVATHWHDDHVRGLTKLVRAYPEAPLWVSGALRSDEAGAFFAAYNGSKSTDLTRGTAELYGAVQQAKSVFWAIQRMTVLELFPNGVKTIVSALSPVHAAHSATIAKLASYIPREGDSVNHAPDIQPNIESIALHIDFGHDAVLLGSDLEEHPTLGWTAVTQDVWCAQRTPAHVYKVAHHGSSTAEHAGIWTKLLAPKPISLLTPFVRGSVRLPRSLDQTRIRQKSSQSYISSNGTLKPKMDSRVLKRLNDIGGNVKRFNAALGAVRMRKRYTESDWRIELFGAAARL